MPPGDSSRWRPSFYFGRAARFTPTIFIPFRPFVFVARRTLIFCAALLISYVLVTNMIGYERLWSTSLPSVSSATTMANNLASDDSHATTVGRHLLNRRQQKQQAEHDSRDIDVRAGHADNVDRTSGNETGDRGARSKADELVGVSDLVVDQPEPRLSQNENYSTNQSKDATGVNGTGLDDESVAKTGDTEEDLTDSALGRREGDKNGAQLIETILLNRTAAYGTDEHRQQRMVAESRRRPGSHAAAKLPSCPIPSPDLTGKMKQAVLLMSMLKESDVIRSHPELSRGGHWKPDHCKARYKIAVIVPFRDRQSHLNRLIDFLIPMMERQLLDFRFIVTEQYGKDLFNKGRIMNAAFLLAEKLGVDCVIFHDVDMFPQDDRNYYYCPNEPKHLGAFVNTLGYELWYDYIVGGVLAINIEHYRQINGYSNMYWAWGGEDDDMGYRILANNLTIERPEKEYGTYTMLKHIKRQRTAPSMIYKLLNTAKTRWTTDGLNQVEWKVVKLIVKPLYYHLYVDVGIPPDEWRYEKPTTKKK